MGGRCAAPTLSRWPRCSASESGGGACGRRGAGSTFPVRSVALADLDVFAPDRPGVELARTADAHARVGDHLLPVRHPAYGARDGEHHREHRAWDADRAVDHAGIEVDVGV